MSKKSRQEEFFDVNNKDQDFARQVLEEIVGETGDYEPSKPRRPLIRLPEKRKNEVLGVIYFAAAIFLLYSLISWKVQGVPHLEGKIIQITKDVVSIDINKESGLKGISGTSDMRDIEDAEAAGDEKAKLAIDMYCYHIKKIIGGYAAAMGGLDAIVFTAGIGENGPIERERICAGLEFLGAKLDLKKNDVKGKDGFEGEISTEDATVKIYLILTNEELMIAQDTMKIVSQMK